MTVSVTLANATNRTTVIVEDTQTVADILGANGFATSGVTVHAAGTPVADINKTLAELNIGDGTMIMTVPFQKAGRK